MNKFWELVGASAAGAFLMVLWGLTPWGGRQDEPKGDTQKFESLEVARLRVGELLVQGNGSTSIKSIISDRMMMFYNNNNLLVFVHAGLQPEDGKGGARSGIDVYDEDKRMSVTIGTHGEELAGISVIGSTGYKTAITSGDISGEWMTGIRCFDNLGRMRVALTYSSMIGITISFTDSCGNALVSHGVSRDDRAY